MITAASIITGATPGNEGRDNEVVAKLANKFTSQLKDALKNGMGEWKHGNGKHILFHLSGSHDQLVTSLHRCTSLVIQSSPPSPSPPPSTPPPLSPLSLPLFNFLFVHSPRLP